jgi:hypothetical protein
LKKSRFTESQIVGILKEVDAGTPVAELARKQRHSRQHDSAALKLLSNFARRVASRDSS